ncbi:hypothetical protein [Halorhabdus amylolytica]|uniref:hypothetical protein n=1 Tax=Halorhabdus amylolytica TaxID=2559573 RepID=UPI0010A9BD42|nr:hypothetical protein [Halorhabdus amylolytica]
MSTIGWRGLVIAAMICSVVALTGCAGVQMEVDESPGPQELGGYNLTIGEPTTGEIFEGIYSIGSIHETGGEVGFKLPNQTEALASIRIVKTQENDTKVHDVTHRSDFDQDDTLGLETPIYPSTDKYRYRVEALNGSDAVIDTVNVTIVDT